MRRAAVTIVATVFGVVLLLQFKSHPAGTTAGGLADVGTSVRPRPQHHAPQRHAVRRPQHTNPPAPAQPATITGQPVQTPYGVVQVKITAAGSHLVNVVPVTLPHGSARSSEIAAAAAPILHREALQADSAQIDIVSGATYTSDGYAQSLQSALDRV